MDNRKSNAVSVVHLIWMDYGIELFKKFLESYIKNPSGYPHELVLLFNGVNEVGETEPYLDLILKTGTSFQSHINYQRSQDLEAYFWITDKLSSHYILFLNSYAGFNEPGWLEKYMRHIDNKEIGIIGATGSWLSYYRTSMNQNPPKWEPGETLGANIKKYRTFLKASLYWRWFFPDFPNPHLRTNAFLISRPLMMEIKSKPLGSKKFNAYLLESGNNSITRQVLKKGLKAMVLDRHGILYGPENWDKSKVFWISEQENLLVSDNQTQLYAGSSASEKSVMSFNAWGIK